MANLYRYAPSNEKTGYFLRGLSPSSGYFNLQTTPAANRLFDQLNYEAGRLEQTEGDSIPGELTWRMYQAGLLETDSPSSGINDLSKDELRESFQESNAQATLSDADLDTLRSFIKSYSGTGANQLAELTTLVEPIDRDHHTAGSNTSNTGVELSDESLSQLSEWGIDVDDVSESSNEYPEETTPYLNGCISRFGKSKYTPIWVQLREDGIPQVWFRETGEMSSVKSIGWGFEDYFAQTSGRFSPIDAQIRCVVTAEWEDDEEIYGIDGIVKSGSFLEFKTTPPISDVFDYDAGIDIQHPETVYLRAISEAKQLLEEELEAVFTPDIGSLFD
ncbi:hypothetical protein [Natronomonas amylolytica]|uniref:hypothetical protein n=1 Tax=Natronomonas amylolytica TaxID=3108498 RepID=UPI00300B17D8